MPASTPAPTPAFTLDLSGAPLDARLRWHCEPPDWRVGDGRLRVATAAGTDFWQRTHYGFEADNGHFLCLEAEGDFVLTTCVLGQPVHQYDQAGLMLRVSPSCWIKTSVEFEPAEATNRLGAVVTNHQYSDWSTQPLAKSVDRVWFRLRAEGCDCIVETSLDGRHWEQIRMARLQERDASLPVQCGLYACSPKAAGYLADFELLSFQPGRL
jgi:regulation of enolase protein 1 (concanavalin A-like superfamily)